MILQLIALVCVGCLATAGAVALYDSKCAHYCSEGSSKYEFSPDTSHLFSYESENELQSEKTPELITKLTAKVKITTLSKCEMVLELSGVMSDSNEFTNLLERNPLLFAWNDGKIERVCPHPLDSDNVLNVKKAILSSIQNTMKTFDMSIHTIDTGILGTCDTAYNATVISPEKYVILKTTDVQSCSNHLQGHIPLLITPYESSSHRQHLPLLSDEKSSCEHIIDKGVIKEVQCHDEGYFKPLLDYGYVVKATGRSKLTKISSTMGKITPYETTKKENLIFKYQPSSQPNPHAEEEIQNILLHICQNSETVITKEAASYTHKLVYTIRQMDAASIERIYERLKSKELCNRGEKTLSFYLDALRIAMSKGSITVLTKLALNGELSDSFIKFWLNMLPFTAYVEEQSISSLIPLLRKGANSHTLLGTTALAYKYCSIIEYSSNTECESTQSITDFSSTLKDFLGDKCSTRNQDEEIEMITALKAFGNLGYFGDRGNDLLDCALNPTNTMDIRLAAIDAFRRSPCKEETISKLLDVYSNEKEHDELRIAALLQVTRCASKTVMQRILDVYFSETSKQVEVFTWSLLENIRKGEDPSQSRIRKYLGFMDIAKLNMKKPKSIDITKFSRNFDLSLFSPLINLGAAREANLIYSSDSFIPRSGNIAHKLKVFGHHVETVEIGARAEGLEHALEKMFGPVSNTNFSTINFQQLLKQVEWIQNIPAFLKKSKRSAGNYESTISSLSEKVGYQRNKIPRGTAFFRVTGHELGVFHLNEESFKYDAGVNVADILKNLASLRNADLSQNVWFLDIVILSPSITGKAYKFALNNSITLGMKVEGKVDVKSHHSFPEVDIDGKFKPSILSEMSSSFTIDGDSHYEPGVQVETNLNGALDYKVKLEVKDSRLVHVKLTPEEKRSEILNIKQRFYYMSPEGKMDMQKPPSLSVNYCTEFLQKLTGTQICASATYSEVHDEGKFVVPFAREFEASIFIEQTDSTDMVNGHEFLLEIPDYHNTKKRSFKFLADTPNSVQDRKFSLNIDSEATDENSHSLTANLHTPFYTLDANVHLMDKEDLFHLKTDVTADGERRYSLNVDAAKVIKGTQRSKYQPIITLSLPSLKPMEFKGAIDYTKEQKDRLTLIMESSSLASPFIIRGIVEKEGDANDLYSNWKLNCKFQTKAFKQIHKFHAGIGYDIIKGMSVDAAHHYEPDGRSDEKVIFIAKVQNIKLLERLSFSLDSQVLFAEQEDLNAMFKWHFSFKPFDHLNSDIIVRYGKNFDDDRHLVRLTFLNAIQGDFNSFQKLSVENKAAITITFLNIEKSCSLLASWDFIDEPKFAIGATIKSGKGLLAEFNLHHRVLEKSPLKLQSNISFTYNTYNFKYADNLVEFPAKTFTWNSVIEPTKDNRIENEISIKIDDGSLYKIAGSVDIPDFDSGGKYKMKIGFRGNLTIGDINVINLYVNWGSRIHEQVDVQLTSRNEIVKGVKKHMIGGYMNNDERRINMTGSLSAGSMNYINGPHYFKYSKSEDGYLTEIEIKHAIINGIMQNVAVYLLDGEESMKQEMKGKMIYEDIWNFQILGNYTINSRKKSPYRGTNIYFRLISNLKGETALILSNYIIKIPKVQNPKDYKGNFVYHRKKTTGSIRSNFDVSAFESKLCVVNILVNPENGIYNYKLNFAPSKGKKFNLITSFAHGSRFTTFNHSLDTNLFILETVNLQAVADLRNIEDAKIHSYMDLNSHNLYSANSTIKINNIADFNIQAKIRSKFAPNLDMFCIAQTSTTDSRFNCYLSVDSENVITGNGKLKNTGSEFSCLGIFKYKEEKILSLDVSQNNRSAYENNFLIKTAFPSHVSTFYIKVNKEKRGIVQYDTKFCPNKETCISVNAIHKEYNNTKEWDISFKGGKVELNVENIRESSKTVERYHTVVYKGDKRFGCDVRYAAQGSGKSMRLGIILPTREIMMKGTAVFSRTKPRIKIDFSADGKNHPDVKFSVDAKIENMENHPSKLDLKIAHHKFEKPVEIQVSYNWEPLSSKYLTAEATLDYSNNPEDKLIAKLSVEDSSQATNLIFLNISHKDDEHLDLVVNVNSTFTPLEKIVAVNYKWLDEYGGYTENYVIASHLLTEGKMNLFYHRPDLDYKLSGKIIYPASLLNNTFEVDFESVYDGMATRKKLILDYETSCYRLVATNNEQEISEFTELCINFDRRKMLTLLSEGLNDKGEWEFQYMFDIVKKDGEYIGFRQQNHPDFFRSKSTELTSFANKVDEKFQIFFINLNNKVTGPFAEFVIPELTEMVKDIGIAKETFNEEFIEYYYKNMPYYEDVEKNITKVSNLILKAEKELRGGINSYFSKYYIQECKKNDLCHDLLRSYEADDWKGVSTALLNIWESLKGSTQRHVVNRSTEVEQSSSNIFKDVLEWCSDFVNEFVSKRNECLQPIVHAYQTLLVKYHDLLEQKVTTNEYIQAYYGLLEKIKHLIKQAIPSTDQDMIITYLDKRLRDFYESSIKRPSIKINANQYDTQKSLLDFDVHEAIFINTMELLSFGMESLLSVTNTSAEEGLVYHKSSPMGLKRIADLEFIPPYEAQAVILGNRHFITFDKAFYYLSGECSYLLASDVEDHNFTAVFKSKEEHEAASIVVLRGDSSIEITSNSVSVRVSDKAVQLPYITEDVSVTREGNTNVVNTKNGFLVKCNWVYEICAFKMSGWYYGKTAGLLGNYNYEKHDDLNGPTGIRFDPNYLFPNIWEMGDGCRGSYTALESRPEINENAIYSKMCYSHFALQTSPLASCFEDVSPEEYFNLCIRYLASESDHQKALCNVAAAYVTECKKNYVELNLPSECLKCDAPDGSILEHGDRRKFENLNKQSVDTVFLVEDHECNKVLIRDLEHFARSIEEELENEGFTESMFSVVGFGGNIGDPQIFTAADKLFFNSRDLNTISEAFKLESTKSESSRAFEAIHHAITHLTRSTNVKLFVLFSCSACQYDYSSLPYPEVQQMLLERGITLHVVKDNEIPILKNSTGKNKVIGVDSGAVFFAKESEQKPLLGESSLRPYVIMPKDYCIALCLDVNGTFFSTHQLSKASTREIRTFQKVFARRFSQSAQLSSCQWCECTSTVDHLPNIVCEPCEIKRPQLPFFIGSSVSAQRRTWEASISYLFHMINPHMRADNNVTTTEM